MDKVLVTGGAGFIGSHVCERLIGEGFHVFCLDDFNNAYPTRFKKENISELLKKKYFTSITGDVCDAVLLKRIFRRNKIDRVIHLAARAGIQPSMENPELYTRVNVLGTVTVAWIAAAHGLKQFISASSSSVYGDRANGPFRENDSTNQPISPYAGTKKATEVILAAFARQTRIPTTILRLFSVYGPRGRPDMAPYLFTDAVIQGKSIVQYGDGAHARDYTYIDDVVNGIVTTLRRPLDFEIINLGFGHPVRMKSLIKIIETLLKKKSKVVEKTGRDGDVRLTYADTAWAKRLLGWEASTPIEVGMQKFVDWFLAERV